MQKPQYLPQSAKFIDFKHHPLLEQFPEPTLTCPQSSVIRTLLNAVQEIAYALRHSPVLKLQSKNKFGDVQLHQDIHCDQIVEKHLRLNHQVKGFASEERPDYMAINGEEQEVVKGQGENENSQLNKKSGYVVTYDPLDGSSIIDTNFTVGSIYSIWPETQNKLIGQTLDHQRNAILALYGPRTTVIFYNRTADKVQELTLLEDKWILSHEHLTIRPETKLFSPGNLRAVNDSPQYSKIVQGWIQKQYTLRYTGGMVPDVEQIFIKGHGIFANIQSAKHKAKLRVLYEVAAVGFLIQKAGGSTMSIGKKSLLSYEIKTYDDRMYLLVICALVHLQAGVQKKSRSFRRCSDDYLRDKVVRLM